VSGIEELFYENGMIAKDSCGNVFYRWNFTLNNNSSREEIEMVR